MSTLASYSDAPALAAAIAELCDQARQEGDSWKACCPAHDDTTPSLSVSPAEDRILLHCFAGCTSEAVVAALGLVMADLFVKGVAQSNGHKHEVKRYDYHDAHGTLVHQTIRYEPKDFKQCRPDPARPGEDIWNLRGITPVLYNLPQVLQAIQDGKRVFVVEGEKDADRLYPWVLGVGEVATTNPMGAEKWKPHYSDMLRGAHVVMLPDNDAPGRKHIVKVAQSLQGIAASLKVVELPGLHEKGDVSDWLDLGHTWAELEALVDATSLWIPPQDAQRRRNGQTAGGGRPTAPPQQPGHTTPALADEDYPYGDAYNALALVRAYGQNLRYCTAWKSWLTWTGTHWQRDTTGLVMRWQRQTVKAFGALLPGLDDKQAAALLAHIKSSLNTTRLKAAIEQAFSWEGMSLAPEAFDTDPWLLNCMNGTLDLRTGTLQPHHQADMLTKCLPTTYDPDAQCPTWERFLWRIMGGTITPDNPDMSAGELENREKADKRAQSLIAFLQCAVGYTLTGSTREQCLFLLHGPTKTGKSTFLGTLRALLGPYGQQADMESFMHKDRPEVRNDIADLAGSRMVCALEGQEGRRLAESLVKHMTGGTDTLKARFLYEEHFIFKPQFKIWLGTNHLPRVQGDDDAIWERLKRVPFIVQIPKSDRDKGLDSRLQDELPGILAWAVRGCLAWLKHGDLAEPPAVTESTAEYRKEMDTIAPFLEECCTTGDPAIVKVKAAALATAYQAWCKRTSETPLPNMKFIAYLEGRGYRRNRGTANQYYWHGLGLINTDDERYG